MSASCRALARSRSLQHKSLVALSAQGRERRLQQMARSFSHPNSKSSSMLGILSPTLVASGVPCQSYLLQADLQPNQPRHSCTDHCRRRERSKRAATHSSVLARFASLISRSRHSRATHYDDVGTFSRRRLPASLSRARGPARPCSRRVPNGANARASRARARGSRASRPSPRVCSI